MRDNAENPAGRLAVLRCISRTCVTKSKEAFTIVGCGVILRKSPPLESLPCRGRMMCYAVAVHYGIKVCNIEMALSKSKYGSVLRIHVQLQLSSEG